MIQFPLKGGSWWGAAFLLVWVLLRWGAAYFTYPAMDRLSILPCIAGFTLFVGGWQAMRWAWPAIVFLSFMLPLPGFCAELLSGSLQRIATIMSIFVIQTVGISAMATGNVIHLANVPTPLEIEQACSGIRMLMLLRPWWERLFIFFSAVPIAIISNVMRITLTAFLYHLELGEWADEIFHDYMGYLMMPIGLVLLWGEMVLLKKMFNDLVPEGPLSLAGTLADASGDSRSRE